MSTNDDEQKNSSFGCATALLVNWILSKCCGFVGWKDQYDREMALDIPKLFVETEFLMATPQLQKLLHELSILRSIWIAFDFGTGDC